MAARQPAPRLFLPIAIAVDGAGNVYIADAGSGLRKVDTSGIINSVPVISSSLSKIASPGGMTVGLGGERLHLGSEWIRHLQTG